MSCHGRGWRPDTEEIMKRGAAYVLGAGLALLALATPARAQVHVDVGVLTPNVGARVVIGPPPVYVVERYREPVYVVERYREPVYVVEGRRPRGHGRGWSKREREYYKDVREARREYEKDRREAEREYLKDVREAEREYYKDLREARRDRRW
jgi:hypothetical protein